MATTYELKICGKVQHVGFRDRIEDFGRGLGVDGVVYNYEDGTVRILANFDDEEIMDLFKRSIKTLAKKDKLIKIDEIEEKELNTYIEFPKGINRISADDLMELNKKLDEGVMYIKMIFGVMDKLKKGQDVLIKGQEGIKETQLKMIEILSKISDTLERIEKNKN
jgi:acylphosphatase